MLEGKGSRDEQVRLGSRHEEFLELCALATSGSLNEAEWKRLREHLATCSECRDASEEFDAVVDGMIPELAPEFREDTPLDPSFSQEKAEASFRKRLTDEKKENTTEWKRTHPFRRSS
jgi:anti-sigma factor ChrR (cupin superfamily)